MNPPPERLEARHLRREARRRPREPIEERPRDLGDIVELRARWTRRKESVEQLDARAAGRAGQQALAGDVRLLEVKERVENEGRKRLERCDDARYRAAIRREHAAAEGVLRELRGEARRDEQLIA